jgi:nitrogen fixation protein NifB
LVTHTFDEEKTMSRLNIQNHPCFNIGAKGSCGRVHLPVAPNCNIKCNYCNRKYDCVNESRPGVTSSVLSPDQAVIYLEQVLEKAPNITVAGIAGPGDAFADPKVTLDTLRGIRRRFPDLLLCLATNGLNLAPYVEELAELEVSHVTMTVNAVDPEIGSRIYGWVRDGKVVRRGLEAANTLLKRQLAGILALKELAIVVKVNTIVIPGVNDHHVIDVALKMSELGVDIQNCMTMYPNADTPFANVPEPNPILMSRIRAEAEAVIPQMHHCTRCRADAVGLLDNDHSAEFGGWLSECSHTYSIRSEGKPYVAVGTMEGMLVNQHLGEVERFQIWGPSETGFVLMEERQAPPRGTGMERWYVLAEILSDCRAVLVSGIGETPKQVLTENAILPVEMNGFIQPGLDAIYSGREVTVLKGRRHGCAKTAGCSATGLGC